MKYLSLLEKKTFIYQTLIKGFCDGFIKCSSKLSSCALVSIEFWPFLPVHLPYFQQPTYLETTSSIRTKTCLSTHVCPRPLLQCTRVAPFSSPLTSSFSVVKRWKNMLKSSIVAPWKFWIGMMVHFRFGILFIQCGGLASISIYIFLFCFDFISFHWKR